MDAMHHHTRIERGFGTATREREGGAEVPLFHGLQTHSCGHRPGFVPRAQRTRRGRTRRRPRDPVEKLAESGREQESNYHLASTDPGCSMLRHSDADYI